MLKKLSGDLVIIRPTKKESVKVVNGVMSKTKSDEMTGTVVLTGPGSYEHGQLVPMDYLIGDTVMFFATSTIELDNEIFYLLSQKAIIGSL